MMKRNRFQENALRYLAGELSEAELADFQAMLKKPGAVDSLVRLARREGMLVELVRSQGEIGGEIGAARRRRFSRLTWMAPLAAAAGITIIVGLFFFRTSRLSSGQLAFSQADHTPRIERTIGSVRVTGNTVSTAQKSLCLLEYSDHTMIAMAESSSTEFPVPKESGSKDIRHKAGLIFVEAPQQHKPLLIRSGRLTTEILGTRVLANAGQEEVISLLKGRTLVSHTERSRAYLREGQQARPVFVGDTPCVAVGPQMWTSDRLSWMSRLGLDPGVAPDESMEAEAHSTNSPHCLVTEGAWEIKTENATFSVLQHEAEGQSTLLLGEPNCRNGLFSFSFRPLNFGPESAIGPVFYYDSSQSRGMLFDRELQKYVSGGYKGWFDVNILFQMDPRGNIKLPTVEILPSEDNSSRSASHNIMLPANRPTPSPCGPGLRTANTGAEFKNIALTKIDTASGRFREGMLALFLGSDGRGDYIPNRQTEHPDWMLSTPENRELQRYSDHVRGHDITAVDKQDRLRQAWEKNRGFTVELWTRYPGPEQALDKPEPAILSLDTSVGSFNVSGLQAFSRETKELSHAVCVFDQSSSGGRVRIYSNGLLTRTIDGSMISRLLASRSGHADLRIFPGQTGRDCIPTPLETELHLAAIYDRPLSHKDILQNYFCSIPEKPERVTDGRIASLFFSTQDTRDLCLVDNRRALANAWKKSNGLTFEIWFKYSGPAHPKDRMHTIMTFKSPIGKFHDNTSDGFTSLAGKACHLTCVLSDDKGVRKASFYSNGQFVSEKNWPWLNKFISRSPLEIQLLPSAPGKGAVPLPPQTDILFAEIYGRPLSPDEIFRNFIADIPSAPETAVLEEGRRINITESTTCIID